MFMRGILIWVFSSIDKIIYWFVEKMYELFILISEAGVFSQSTIQEFSKRIYVFLGLIMIFQVTISLVNYIINPSTFDDKNIGGAALIKNAAISLVGIVLVPYVFEAAYGLQRIVLKENVIGNLILGVKTWDSQEEAESFVAYGGRKMAFSTYSSFVTFNSEVASSSCINEPVLYPSYEFNSDACGKIGDIPFDSGVTDDEGNALNTVGQYMSYVYKTANVKALAYPDFLKLEFKSTEGNYDLFDYSYVISTIAGGFLIYILFKFCLDIAVRSVKLSFLQLIAPIPLMMRIDPRKGKQKFNKWVGECAKTFGDVFVRLAAIYFAIFIISAITTDGVQNVSGSANNVQAILVKVAIIFGALMFAQQIPLLIGDIIGGGKETMQALSKTIGRATGAATGLAGGAVIGAGLGALGNAWAAGKNWKNMDGNFGKKLVTSAGKVGAGFSSGMYHGGRHGLSSDKMSYANMKNAGVQGMKDSRQNAINRENIRKSPEFQKNGEYSYGKFLHHKFNNQFDDLFEYQDPESKTTNMIDKKIEKLNIQKDDVRTEERAAREHLSNMEVKFSSKMSSQSIQKAASYFKEINKDTERPVITRSADEAWQHYQNNEVKYNPSGTLTEEEFRQYHYINEQVINKHEQGINIDKQIKEQKSLKDVNKSLQSNKSKPGDKK